MDMILLAAGASTRFTADKPKFLLPMPNNKLMFVDAIHPFINQVDHVYLVIQQAHEDQYQVSKIAQQEFGNKISVICLPYLTKGPAESAKLACEQIGDRAVFVKDCDSFFTASLPYGNFICTTHWDNKDASKSYVKQCNGMVEMVAEKEPISSNICVGGYGFASTRKFVEAYNKVSVNGEIFVSAVINEMLDKTEFGIVPVGKYVDVGVQERYDSIISNG